MGLYELQGGWQDILMRDLKFMSYETHMLILLFQDGVLTYPHLNYLL